MTKKRILKKNHVKEYLDKKWLRKLADEADELGYFEFDLQGLNSPIPARRFTKGDYINKLDLLTNKIFKKLFEVLEAIKPERFYMYLTTNGYYLDEKNKETKNLK